MDALSSESWMDEETDVEKIQAEIKAFTAQVQKTEDAALSALVTGTTFPVEKVFSILAARPDIAYLRVYNAIDALGNYHTYMGALDGNREPLAPAGAVYVKSCCPCRPCTISN